MELREYKAMVRRHTDELKIWLKTLPDAGREALDGTVGAHRTLDEYLDEYSGAFAIVPRLASDMGYPLAGRMMSEYRAASDLEDLMS